MAKSSEINVNPEVLKTLRESSGYTVEEIAKKINSTKEQRPSACYSEGEERKEYLSMLR